MKNYLLIILTIVCFKSYGQTQADKDLNGVVYDLSFFSNISSDWRNNTLNRITLASEYNQNKINWLPFISV